MIKPEDQVFRITSARLANEKKLLSFTNRRLTALQSMLDLETRMTNQRLALERLTQGSTVTAEDEAKVLRDQQAKADKLEDEKLTAKLKGIDLEYDLLAAQFTLEEAKIDRLAKELANLNEGQISALKAPVTAAKAAIEGDEDCANCQLQLLQNLKQQKTAEKLQHKQQKKKRVVKPLLKKFKDR